MIQSEKILEVVKERLNSIKIAEGFNTDVAHVIVGTDNQHVPDEYSPPLLSAWVARDEAVEVIVKQQQKRRMLLIVEGEVLMSPATQQQLMRLMLDVELALAVWEKPALNNTAHKVTADPAQYPMPGDGAQIVTAQQQFQIDYVQKF